MRRPSWRWGVLAALVGVLVATPSLVAALPADAGRTDPAALLARVRASADVGWSGYGESRGRLALPDAEPLGDLPALLGGTTRVRAWWAGPQRNRVDALTPVGETGTYTDRAGSWTWQSADRRAVRVQGALPVRLPAAADLLAPVLGRRLAGADAVQVSELPDDAGRTTVDAVDLWAEPDSGLVLRVDIRASGVVEPVLTSLLLDVELRRPPDVDLAFLPPEGTDVSVTEAPDVAALADRFSPYALPEALAGLPRRGRLEALSDRGGVATYGDGFTALALVPLPVDIARRLLDAATQADVEAQSGAATRPDDVTQPDAEVAAISTPLVTGLVAVLGERGYLLAGTVPEPVLRTALAQLRVSPPPRRDDSR